MELPSKLLEQLAFNTIPKIEEHMLIIVNKSTHEEHLFQSLQTNIKQFKLGITFLTGCNGIFNVTNSNNKFSFKKTITDEDGFIQIIIPPVAHEKEALNKESKRNIIDEVHFTEANYPFTTKTFFSTLGSNIEISLQGPIVSFMFNDSMRDLLGFHAITLYKKYNLSPIPVDIISFDNIFIGTDNAKGMIFEGKRNGIIMNFTMSVSPGYKFINRFEGVVQWYMMETKEVISSISFKFKKMTMVV